MDSLGKILDILILIIVMFIFPVRWALSITDEVSEEAVRTIADRFMDEADEKKAIDWAACSKLDSRLRVLTKSFRADISVRRKISGQKMDGGRMEAGFFDNDIPMTDITEEMEAYGLFSLSSGDILNIKIFDKNGVFYIATGKIL